MTHFAAMRRAAGFMPAVLVLLIATAPLRAGVETRIVWVEGKPHAEVRIDAESPQSLKEIDVPAELTDAQGARVWKGVIKVPAVGERPWKMLASLQNIKDPKKQHKLSLRLSAEWLEDYAEEIYFAAESALVQTYGLRVRGFYPARKVSLTLGLNGFKSPDARDIPVSLRIRDGEDNAVLTRQTLVKPAREPQLHVIDVTPAAGPAGPFTLDVSAESESNQLFFNAGLKFAQANARVPLSSFEHGDPAFWFAGAPTNRPNYQTHQFYYSPHLTDLKRYDTPAIRYERTQKHSGRQALRIDYPVNRESDVWSLQALPGKPLALGLWVHGNGSNDQLVIHFEDNSNFTAPAWQRNADFSTAVLGTLNFTGWRRFRVPVLGEGLQATSTKGATEKVDAPVRILALTVKPEPLPKGVDAKAVRSVWVDDLEVETQVLLAETLSLEMQLDDAQGRLTPEGTLAVTVGNGFAAALKRGKVMLTARVADAPIWTRTVDLPVEAERFALTEVPLKELADKKPHGPVDLDVTFQDAGQAGARITGRITLKAAAHAGIVHDFEEPITFSGYQPGKVGKSEAKVVPGGADGSAHSLALPVKPNQDDNSILFHPALPGILDRVEVMVQGGDRPVTLQPWFIDSGYTGIWLRPYNLFWTEPIRVDWQGWRKVTIPAPPIPAYHGDKNRYFLFRPWYPLNFAVNAKLIDGDAPTEIRFDNLRVVTHLPDDELLKAEVEYPDDTHIHPPGSPLRLLLYNFAATSTPLVLPYELRNYQGLVVRSGKLDVTVPAGTKLKVTLVDALPPGIYDLTVQGAGKNELTAPVLVLDAGKYFGDDPGEILINPLLLRRQLGLTTEKTYLDWDNVEPAPYLRHSHWFEEELKKLRDIKILPKELQPLAAKFDAATTAVKAAEKDRETKQQQATQASQAEKPFATRVEAMAKQLNMVRAEEKAAVKRVAAAEPKVATAVKEADTARAAAEEAMKALKVGEAEVKTTQGAQAAADRALPAVLAAFKDADQKAKAAQEAQSAVEKAWSEAEKAAKTAEADPKNTKAKELRARADDLKKKADAAKTVAAEALKLAQAKKADANKARAAAEEAKTAVALAQTKAKNTKQTADQAAQKATAAVKATEGPKRELATAMQQLQTARQKTSAMSKAFDDQQKAWQDRVKAAQDAQTALDAATKALAAARAELDAVGKEFEQAKAKYAFTIQPVVGFCADWAGPEAVETLRKQTYTRWIPNRLQLPRHLIDWSQFVRETQREYRGRFDTWVFWENPDLDEAPQSIPPKTYAPMLETFARWVKLYSPGAKVVAGGFNFPKALDYLQKVPDAAKLPFDELAVQMNLGELSPEHADVEGFLDDLNSLLKIPETKRTVRLTELDWGIGKYLSPLQQAAYHARAALILDSRGVPPHQFNLINTGFEFDGYGVCYRIPYGNTAELQTHKPYHIPKPSYFALIEAEKFLREWKYVAGVNLSDRSLADNRAFVYRNPAGALTAVLWRAVEGARVYRVPAAWRGVEARDIFGFSVPLEQGLRCTPMPTLVHLPAGYQVEQLLFDLRTLEASDGSYPVLLDLHLAEPDSARRAGYQASGKVQPMVRGGTLLGERKVRETYLEGLESERFEFELPQSGNVLLRRRWHFQGDGQKLYVRLNDGPEEIWDQGKGQGNDPGLRETTFVLRACKAGKNMVTIRYEKPGNCAGYRLEPMPVDHLPLVRAGMLNARQTKGEALKHTSAVGTPLMLGKSPCGDGIGAHATSFIEYPLAGQFQALEVTVGIDGSTEGRGSVVFHVYVDGKERANSGPVNGFSKPKTLKIDGIAGAQRLILSVTDAEDGNRDDLANWVDGKLYLKDK
jgi:hypothetical protein